MEQDVGGILGDLIKRLKDVTRDTDVESPLWSIDEWIEYLNDAEREICRRAHVLNTDITVTLASGVQTYDISSKTIDTEEKAYLNYDDSFLTKVTKDWMNHYLIDWRTDTGTPTKFAVDYHNSQVSLYPIPTDTEQGYTITFKAKVLPTTSLSMTSFTPSIPSKYYDEMKLWALYRAYSKKDAETNDEKQALKYLQMFDIAVGPRSSINVERIMMEEPGDLRISVRRR